MKNLHPITSANGNLIDKKTGEVYAVRYLPGYPRQIRFDASKGNFNLNGDVSLTKKGEEFSFIPIAYRIFNDNILGMGKKRWAEFFFLNEARQVCAVLFHGYSVENFMRLAANEMFYDDVTPCDVVITARPVEKECKDPDAPGKKYFMAEFSYKKLEKGDKDTLFRVTEGINFWREETTTGDARIEFALNWNPPHPVIELNGQPAEAEAEAAAVAA
jgi:hypothetical protein